MNIQRTKMPGISETEKRQKFSEQGETNQMGQMLQRFISDMD